LAFERLLAAESALATSGTEVPVQVVDILSVRAEAMSSLGNDSGRKAAIVSPISHMIS
jgi:hypothetical protein